MELLTKNSKTTWFNSNQKETKILVAGDWHVGDKYGILPCKPIQKDGTGIMASSIQRKMYKQLEETLEEIGDVDVLIVPGDTCEGKQLKTYGVPLIDSDTDNQVNWAFELYDETFHGICRPRITIVIMGTPYHSAVGIGGNLDFQVASKMDTIGDVYFGYPNAGFYLGRQKLLWDIRHRISIARVNRLMPLEKMGRMFARLQHQDGVIAPDVIGRAHDHSLMVEPFNYSTGKIPRYAFVSPCLKADDIYGQSMVYPDSAKIGVMTITQTDNEVTGKYHPFDISAKGVKKV